MTRPAVPAALRTPPLVFRRLAIRMPVLHRPDQEAKRGALCGSVLDGKGTIRQGTVPARCALRLTSTRAASTQRARGSPAAFHVERSFMVRSRCSIASVRDILLVPVTCPCPLVIDDRGPGQRDELAPRATGVRRTIHRLRDRIALGHDETAVFLRAGWMTLRCDGEACQQKVAVDPAKGKVCLVDLLRRGVLHPDARLLPT